MRTLLALMVAVAAGAASAHPPVSVVIDARGNVYYSDLRQVWRVAPDGTKSIAVSGVHTHELAIDPDGTIYGEHLWYDGERLDTWGHYVWKRTPDGVVSRVVAPRPGFLRDYSFVRDRSGNMYWAERERNEIRRRTPAGRIETIARGRFRDVRWMTVTPEGIVYFADGADLVRVRDGRALVVAKRIGSRPAPASLSGGRHVLMGLWTDPHGNVYAADHHHRAVKRVTPGGRVSVVHRPPVPWAPAGGAFAPNGDLWLLETAPGNVVRVRKVGKASPPHARGRRIGRERTATAR